MAPIQWYSSALLNKMCLSFFFWILVTVRTFGGGDVSSHEHDQVEAVNGCHGEMCG